MAFVLNETNGGFVSLASEHLIYSCSRADEGEETLSQHEKEGFTN